MTLMMFMILITHTFDPQDDLSLEADFAHDLNDRHSHTGSDCHGTDSSPHTGDLGHEPAGVGGMLDMMHEIDNDNYQRLDDDDDEPSGSQMSTTIPSCEITGVDTTGTCGNQGMCQ